MKTDTEICLKAIREARLILSEYIDPLSPYGAVKALDRLIEILDGEEVDAALSRIDTRKHFRVMDFRYSDAMPG